MAYLLGTQALVDAAKNDQNNPIHRWSTRDDPALDEVFVSAASFMAFRKNVDSLHTAQRRHWEVLFDSAMDRYERARRIVPVNHRIAALAGRLATTTLQDRPGADLGDVSLLVVGTALYEQFTLVEKRRPYHHVLEDMERLALIDPYE